MKTVRYLLPYYHYSEDGPMEALDTWIDTLKELLPGWDIYYEVSKRDKGYINIEREDY